MHSLFVDKKATIECRFIVIYGWNEQRSLTQSQRIFRRNRAAPFKDACGGVAELVGEAVRGFAFFSVGHQDGSKMPHGELDRAVAPVAGTGCQRVRLADSVGVWIPFAVERIVRRIRAGLDGIQLDVHMHHDLGMAIAR